MKIALTVLVIIALSSTISSANFSMIQFYNAGSGNFLTGVNGSDFLLDDSAGRLTAN